MSATKQGYWRPVALVLLAALIGIYVLYSWYTGRLDAEIAARDDRIEATTTELAARGREIATLQERIVTLGAEHAEKTRELTARIDAAEKTKAELQEALEQLRKTDADVLTAAQEGITRRMAIIENKHADMLSSERAKLAVAIEERDLSRAAHAEIETKLAAAEARVVEQQADLDAIRQAIVDLALEHRDRIETLERHLNERLELASATPAESALLRVAQSVGLLPESVELEAPAGSDAATAELAERLGDELARTRAALDDLQAASERTQTEQRARIDALESELADARVALERVAGEATAPLEETLATRARELTEAEARIAELTEQLQDGARAEDLDALRAELERARADLDGMRAQGEAQLAELRTQHESVLAEAQAQIDGLNERLAKAPEADRLSELQARQSEDAARIAALEAQIGALEAEKAEQLGRAETLDARVAALSEQLASEQSSARGLVEERETLVGELQAALDETKTALADTRAQLDVALQSGQVEDQAALDAAREQITTLEANLQEERRRADERAAQLEDEAARALERMRLLYVKLSELGGAHTERGVLLKLADTELRFPPGAATLPTGELPSLDRIAALLAEHPDLRVQIEGHTDSVGDAQTNLALSRQRAEAVRDALVERGVEAARLQAEGMGPTRPIADNATPAGRAQNRRVEVYVSEG